MKKTTELKITALATLLLFLSGAALAQAGRGKARLAGVVVDEAGKPIVGAKVRLEFYQSGLKDETTTNKKGEWGFMGLGTGLVNVFASAEGFLDGTLQVQMRQLEIMPGQKIILHEDKERKMRIKDEASLVVLEQGNQFFSEQKFDQALEIYQKFAAENPEVFLIHFNIGDCYREKKEYDKAIESYKITVEKAKEKNDIATQAKGLASIGDVYLRQNNFKQAQDYFKQSIELNPKDEILAYNVAEICFGNNKVDEALQYYQLAIQIKPTWGDPYLKLGYAYLNKGDTAKAKESFAKYLEVNPEGEKAAEVRMILESLKNIK